MTVKSWKVDPAAASTWKATSLNAVSEFTYAEEGTVVPHAVDGVKTVQQIYVDNKTGTATITTSDLQQLNAAAFRVGQSGALVLKGVLRSDGDALDATKMVVTMTYAVLTNISNNVPHGGTSTATLTFQLYHPTGGDLLAYS